MSVLHRAFVVEQGLRTEVKLRRESVPPKTVWTNNRYNAEAYGTDLLKAMLDKRFPYPKSLYAEATILLDDRAFEAWLAALEGHQQLTRLYVVTPSAQKFRQISDRISDVLGPVTVIEPLTLVCRDGFKENLEYFRLDFADPADV